MSAPIHSSSRRRPASRSRPSPIPRLSRRGRTARIGLSLVLATLVAFLSGMALAGETSPRQEQPPAPGGVQEEDPVATDPTTPVARGDETEGRCARTLQRARSVAESLRPEIPAALRGDLDMLTGALAQDCDELTADRLDSLLTRMEERGEAGEERDEAGEGRDDWTPWAYAFSVGFLAAALVGILYKVWT